MGKILEMKLLLFWWYQNSVIGRAVTWALSGHAVLTWFPPHSFSFLFSFLFISLFTFPYPPHCNNTAVTQKLLSNNMSLEKNVDESRC